MFFFLLTLYFIFFPSPVKAVNEFNINQNINYQVDINGNANIKQEIKLSNNLSEIYPKEYQFKIFESDIQNITATDDLGNILQKIEKQGNDTIIYLKFNQAHVGKSQITDFSLNYQISNLAKHKGNVWEISLPEYKNINDGDDINISMSIPASFGNLSFSSINYQNIVHFNNESQIQLSTNNIKDKKILFIFGNYQIFNFDIQYFISNPSNDIINTEIAIPPDLSTQKIFYKKISPPPVDIKIDSDGNWLAQYQLKPNQNLDINLSGQAKIYSSTIKDENIDTENLIKTQKYWPVDDPMIAQITQSLNSPKDIYNYVVNTLNYDYAGLNSATRKGALAAINSPDQSLCTEFTDLFVTLSRAKGIPAREIEGFAYTNNPKIKPTNKNADILHAWPQYYDKNLKSWISIDPTWGKTTNGIDFFNDLDFNHFTFVTHGQDSQYPPPPGSYKDNKNIKTVNISFATEEFEENLTPPKISFSKFIFLQHQDIFISNPNLNSISDITISIPSRNWSQKIDFLPPLGQVNINPPSVPFLKSILPSYQKISFNIQYQKGDNPISYSIVYPPHYINLLATIIAFILILSLGGIILTVQKKGQK